MNLRQQSRKVKIGKWNFTEIQPQDRDLYAEYIKVSLCPANLWSSNFAYLWAVSRSSLRAVLWKVVDGLLVTFGHSYKNSLYLFCLPFGKADAAQLAEVVYDCLKYCFQWNNQENHRTLVRMINEQQWEFLSNGLQDQSRFKLVTYQGIERHLDLTKVTALSGKDFSTVRTKVNKFHREHPEAIFRSYRGTDYPEVIALGRQWNSIAGRKYTKILDRVYYRELVEHAGELQQRILVVEQDRQIIGMVAGGELPTGQAWGSLLKYREGIPGLSEALTVAFAQELQRLNPRLQLLNVGSDLGPGGLRDYKLKFRPVLNLKRYQVYLK